MDYTKENLEGTEMYVTTYSHTVESDYGEPSYTTTMQMMFNPETGASIVGNSSEGFLLYVPDEYGTVHQYAIDQSHGANATTAATQNITDFAYLIKTNDNFVNQSSGLFEQSVSAYGPNGELNPFTPVAGEMTTIKITQEDGTVKEVQVATNNPESSMNYMHEVLGTEGQVVASNTTNNSTSGNTGTTSGSVGGGTTGGYSSSGGNGIFMRGLRGDTKEDFPWIETSRADDFRQYFIEDPTFEGGADFSGFITELNDIIAKANEFIPIVMGEGRSSNAGLRVQMARDAINLTEEYQRMKSSIDSGQFRTAIVTYNDNVEQAKVTETRKALRAACKDYNERNYNVVKTWVTSDSGFRPSGRYRTSIDHYDSENNPIYRYEQYDRIDYDGAWDGIDFGWGLFNMKTDRMAQELQSRGIHVSIEDRPDWTM